MILDSDEHILEQAIPFTEQNLKMFGWELEGYSRYYASYYNMSYKNTYLTETFPGERWWVLYIDDNCFGRISVKDFTNLMEVINDPNSWTRHDK